MTRRRTVTWAVAACAVLAGCAPVGSAPDEFGAASCAAPYVETSPRQAQPGEAVTVVGEFFLDACYDTGQARRAGPLTELPMSFAQEARRTDLGRVDASVEGLLERQIRVPAGAVAGLAEVRVGDAEPALLMVGDGAGGYPPWPGPPKGPFPLTVELRSMPTYPEGGWVVASATTVDFQVPDADKRVEVVRPLGEPEVELGELRPTYWMVDVVVHRCAAPGCAPPATAGSSGCEMEVRIYDGPARMFYRDGGPGGRCLIDSVPR